VDSGDKVVGFDEKINIHRTGKLHRAFSILIFNNKGELLIQKRAKNKYHSGGLWTNSCCSHQRIGENIESSAYKRLKEELGFEAKLKQIFRFHYNTKFSNGLIENEIDYIFVGKYDGEVKPNKEEIEDYKWISLNELKKSVKRNPNRYTYWFKLILKIMQN